MPRRLIHDRIKPYFLRRRKSDVLAELPPIIVQDMYLELGSFQRRAYDELWDNRAQLVCTEGLPASDVHMLAVITKLKLLCNFDPSSEESSKLDALRLVLEGLSEGDDKVILFSQFVTTLRWIAERIGQIPCSMLHGGMSMAERDAAVAEFESEAGPRVFLISLRAGGVGLNLNSASTVIMFDRWWNPALEEQAIQRAHRYGRKRPLHVMRFVVQETVEQRIESILQSKQALFSEYVDGAKNSATAAFTRDELRQILGLRKSESG
jgi:SNF2 family DNA or RNA helicase